jgi:hypothetical protein
METANGKHFVTTQYLRAAHGKSEKEWPFISCSNAHFTEVCIVMLDVKCDKILTHSGRMESVQADLLS